MNYLAVCLGNQLRSPYVAQWIGEYCKGKGIAAEAKSAGFTKDSPTRIDMRLIAWADTAVIMEPYMKELMKELIARSPENCSKIPEIFCIDVPDSFYPDWLLNLKKDMGGLNSGESLIDDTCYATPEEAVRRLQTRKHGERFGQNFFAKILEARLAPYIEAHV